MKHPTTAGRPGEESVPAARSDSRPRQSARLRSVELPCSAPATTAFSPCLHEAQQEEEEGVSARFGAQQDP